MNNFKDYLSITQFAEKLGVTVPTIRNYINAGKIEPTVNCGKHMYFAPDLVNKYLGTIYGKRKSGALTVENNAVLYIAKDLREEVPTKEIDTVMRDNGFQSPNDYDYNRDIEPDELEDFNKFCEKRSFNLILRNKVNKALNEDIEKIRSVYESGRDTELAKIYRSNSYKGYEKGLLETSVGNKGMMSVKEKFDNEINRIVDTIDEKLKRDIEELKRRYSDEYVDDKGDILEDAPKYASSQYIKIYKSLRRNYVRSYRCYKYPVIKHYAILKIVKDDKYTYKNVFKNIFSGIYSTIYVVNKNLLSEHWVEVLEILEASGVASVKDLSLAENEKIDLYKWEADLSKHKS